MLMKHLLLIIIKIYWKLIPKSKRNQCIYNVSCSNHVFETTKNKGLISGIKAFKERFNSCKPGYFLFKDSNEWCLKTVNDILICQENINPQILKDIENE